MLSFFLSQKAYTAPLQVSLSPEGETIIPLLEDPGTLYNLRSRKCRGPENANDRAAVCYIEAERAKRLRICQ